LPTATPGIAHRHPYFPLHLHASASIRRSGCDIGSVDRERERDAGLDIPDRELDFLTGRRRFRELHLGFTRGIGVGASRLQRRLPFDLVVFICSDELPAENHGALRVSYFGRR
jgi:hypothetical protein